MYIFTVINVWEIYNKNKWKNLLHKGLIYIQNIICKSCIMMWLLPIKYHLSYSNFYAKVPSVSRHINYERQWTILNIYTMQKFCGEHFIMKTSHHNITVLYKFQNIHVTILQHVHTQSVNSDCVNIKKVFL